MPTLHANKSESDPLIKSFPILALGFRPFYLAAAGFAAIAVPLWLAAYFGLLAALPRLSLQWHMHEMVFGFAIPVVVGFVFTAARNWTGLSTPRGAHLALLALIWLAARFAMLLAPYPVAALLDMLLIPCGAWSIFRVLRKSGNVRNMFLVAVLLALAGTNVLFHAAVAGLTDVPPVFAIHAAILLIVMLETIIAGRVIPGFTANAIPGSQPVTRLWVTRASIAATASASAAWLLGLHFGVTIVLCLAAAVMHSIRLFDWQPLATRRQPLLWILHLSYSWIAVGFFGLAMASAGLLLASAAIHALAVGSMAGLMLGMMTRTALGHTGRELRSGRAELAMYLLIQLGAFARFFASVQVFGLRNPLLLLAASSWTAAFMLYLSVYGPYLTNRRLDGRDG